MHFSRYIVIEGTGASVDPLGFLKPSSHISAKLFKQFTVLSNHPAYHGFLCFAYQYLANIKITPNQPKFSEYFRDIESLWGVLNEKVGQSILNTTKYSVIAKKSNLNRKIVRKYVPLYTSLHYGTLGHYSSPSKFWGLLNSRRTRLTELGEQLANAWKKRDNICFTSLIDKWFSDKSIKGISDFGRAAKIFSIEAEPSQLEQEVWKKIIDKMIPIGSEGRPLWEEPIPDSSDNKAGFYPLIQEKFKKYAGLSNNIKVAEQFEHLAGITQFIFEWEYVKKFEDYRTIKLLYPDINKVIKKKLPGKCKRYFDLNEAVDTGNLFDSIREAHTYEEIASLVLERHKISQRSKNATPFIQDDMLFISGRVDLSSFLSKLQSINKSPANIWEHISNHYSRKWHFNRVTKWLNYAGGLK